MVHISHDELVRNKLIVIACFYPYLKKIPKLQDRYDVSRLPNRLIPRYLIPILKFL